MPPSEWYYAHEGQQSGPVSAQELKQAADAGRLTPDDLVWQEGMKDWTPARKVKGLFESRQLAAAATAVAAPPVVVATPIKAADRPTVTGERPIVVADRPPAPERRPPARAVPPLEALLTGTARATGKPFVEAASRLFTLAGHWGLFGAMLASLALAVAYAVRMQFYTPLVAQAAILPALAVLQFSSRRLLSAVDRLAKTGGAKVSSTALLETCALWCMLSGLVLLVGMTVLAVQLRVIALALPGLAGFIVFECLAILALNHDALDVALDAEAGPAEDALGILSFLVMAGARLVSVAWGVGVLWATLKLVLAATALFAPPAPPSLLAWQLSIPDNLVLGLMIFAPLWTYLALLAYHLTVALARAVLAIPGLLDKVAQRGAED